MVRLTALVVFAYMCLTDPLAEIWRNWTFSPDQLLGIYMLNFPIEEGLFFLLVPLAVASATLVFASLTAAARRKSPAAEGLR